MDVLIQNRFEFEAALVKYQIFKRIHSNHKILKMQCGRMPHLKLLTPSNCFRKLPRLALNVNKNSTPYKSCQYHVGYATMRIVDKIDRQLRQ